MYRYFAFLFFAFFGSDLFAQEPHLEYVSWETRRHTDIISTYLTHDNILLVNDLTNGGTLWRINPENGEIIDTTYKGDKIKYISFSPSKTIWSLGRTGSHTISNYETNEEITTIDSDIDIKFIDDENIIYYKQNKIYKQNIHSTVKEEIVFERPPAGFKTNMQGPAEITTSSNFSFSNKYAIIDFHTASGHIYILDIESEKIVKTFEGISYCMVNQSKDEFAYLSGKNLYIYEFNNLEIPKEIYYNQNYSEKYFVKYSKDGFALLSGGYYQSSIITFVENYEKLNVFNFRLGLNSSDYINFEKALYNGDGNHLVKYDFTPLFSSVEENYEPLLIQPNPSTESILIQANINVPSNYNFELYNMQGELLHQQNLGLLPIGLFEYNLNISSYSVGTYILKITNGQHTFQSNFIKMN